jgi:hypothetical protein
MAYDLTISRFGAIAGPPVRTANGSVRLCDKKIITTFQEQMIEMIHRGAFYDNILKAAGADKFLTDQPEEPLEVTPMPMDASEAVSNDEKGATLIGLLPPKRLRMDVHGMKWILRARPSVTACALQEQDGMSKLWWTIEGIPADPDPQNRPSEKQVAAFAAETDKIQQAAMPPLHEAFCRSLASVTDKKAKKIAAPDIQIRITMSDNDDRQVGVLFDALYLEGRDFDQIRRGTTSHLKDANRGLKEFESLVRDVTHHALDAADSTVSVKRESLGLAIFYRYAARERQQTIVAGIARRSGIVPGFDFLSPARQREEKSEERLRTRSPARQISAVLAGAEMRALQRAHYALT